MMDHTMNRTLTFWLAVGLAGLLTAGCTQKDSGGTASKATALPETPPELKAGQILFEANCSGCHGIHAVGSDSGPPLVDRIYEPNHHADISFHMAVRRGARAHHWGFGDMPPIPAVKDGDIDPIVKYVRWLQRQAGIQ